MVQAEPQIECPQLDADTPLDVTGSINRHTDNLMIKYKVTNTGDKDVYLLNILWSRNKHGDVVDDPVGAYVSLDQDGTLRVGRFFHPLPRPEPDEEGNIMETAVEQTIVPLARLLKAGAFFEETVSLGLPLPENNPYYEAWKKTKYEDAGAEAVEFYLSWVPGLEGMEERPAAIASGLQLFHPQLVKQIRTICAARSILSVPVKQRKDEFQRFHPKYIVSRK